MTCTNCNKESEQLTRVHVRTGKRGRPPVKLVCGSCLDGSTDEIMLPGEKVAPAPRKSGENVSAAPRTIPGYDPAALFLLDLGYENLFELKGAGTEDFGCKGCRNPVNRRDRKTHYESHKAALSVAA